MKKFLINSFFCIMLLLFGMSANAAEKTSVLTSAELLQIIPVEVQQQAQDGKASTEQSIDGNGYTVYLGQNNGGCYIVSVLSQTTIHPIYGVFDFVTREWRIPCAYDAIFQIPGKRYFLVEDEYFAQVNGGIETSVCYEAEADGTVNHTPLPIQGKVFSVDEEGYVTLVQYETVRSSNPDYADIESGYYAKMALLNNQYQMILDYIAEDYWATPISFINGVAVIRSGSTEQRYAGHYQVALEGSTYGLINRKGEWIGRRDYTNMYRFAENDHKGNARIFAEREESWYWITENGMEIPLSGKASELEERCSDWAFGAIEQAKSRSLVPDKIDGYYTLDIFREEFCSLLMNVYRALGKEIPSLDSAPIFTDCDLEDVRTIAALKVVSGYEDGTFRPRSSITREEAASIISRFISLFQEQDETVSDLYEDDTEIGIWAKPQVYALRNAGIMSGISEDTFSPKNTYTIEQAISVVNRLYDLLLKG